MANRQGHATKAGPGRKHREFTGRREIEDRQATPHRWSLRPKKISHYASWSLRGWAE